MSILDLMNIKPKLIRDKIPDIIKANHKKCEVKILSNTEYKQALKSKLLEEAQEVFDAQEEELIEEIADIYEVIEALIKAYNLDKEKIKKIKEDKANSKGKFEQKLKLISVTNKQNNSEAKTHPILREAEDFLQTEVIHQVNEIDRSSAKLKETFLRMNDLNPNFFRWKLGKEWGGLGIDSFSFYSWQIMMASYSGALSFLQTQHQSAVGMLSNSSTDVVKQKYLSLLTEDNLFFGVGFSHLRKQGEPLVTAIPQKHGYQISGFVPWITGYGIFHYFIVGASLPTGEELYGVLPFTSESSELQLSQPLSLSAMNSTNTVSAHLNDYLLAEEDVIKIRPSQTIHHQDKLNVLHHGFFPLGCSYGGLKILEQNYQHLNLPEMEDVYHGLKSQVDYLKTQMLMAVSQEDNFEEKLRLRTKAIDLAYRCAMGAVISSKGKANYQSNSANRIYREALVYGVSGQTIPILTKTLANLL
jgi:predicted house-cleaning noncanonical NTP pyrophosphatase (MazG superfamily)